MEVLRNVPTLQGEPSTPRAEPVASASSSTGSWLLWTLGAATCIAVVVVAGHFSDLRSLLGLISKLEALPVAFAVLLQLGTYASQGAIWRCVGRATESHVSARFAFQLSLAELFVDQALPTGGVSGTAFAARVLERRGFPKQVVAAGVVARAIAYYAGYALALGLALLLSFSLERWAAGLVRAATGAFLLVSVVAVVVLKKLTGVQLAQRWSRLARIPGVGRVIAFLDEASPMLADSWVLLARVTMLQVVTIVLDVATMGVLIWALGGRLSPAAVFTSFMLSSVFRSLGVAPGGLGSFEASSVFTLHAAGLELPIALSATLLFRGLTFWLPMLPGFALSRSILARSARRPDQQRFDAYWAQSSESLLAGLRSRREGLSSPEAVERLAQVGPNVLSEQKASSRWHILAKQFESPLLWLLVFAALTSMVTGEWVDAAVVSLVIVVSAGIGYSRERSAAVALEPLQARIRTTARVLRDGSALRIPVEEVLPGDVIELAAGSLVPADCVLLEATDLHVSQAVLTGESFPVGKRVGSVARDASLVARTNCVFMGTNVRSGTASCLVVQTGRATQFGEVAQRLVQKPPETEFDRGSRRFGYLLTIVMLCIVICVFGVHALQGRPAIETLLFSIALAVGLSPELLPVILNVNLARGAEALAEHGVLVRRLTALENLGSMDVLCTDKTGTLTLGVVALHGAFAPDGERSARVLALGVENALLSTGLENSLDEALVREAEAVVAPSRKVAEIPFDFLRKRASVLVRDGEAVRLITKGAFQTTIDVCTSDAGGAPLSTEEHDGLRRRMEDWSRQGMRVLAVASRVLPVRSGYSVADESALQFEGFLVFSDRAKPDAAAAIARLSQRGVAVKMVSGDALAVARYIAKEVGLNPERALTGRELDELHGEALWHRAEQTDVFAEVDPNQKERIILALKKMNHVVGFLGDGVNDAPAMHAADVGLSVDQAVDVAREAADLVLLERSLDVIHEGIGIGRKTIANTLKYILTTTSANLGNMVSMAIASLLLPFLPLLSGQILLNNLLSDIPAMGIAADDVDPEQMERPERWDMKLIARFMARFGFLSSAFDLLMFGLLGAVFHATVPEFRSAWFVESLLTELLVALVVRTRRSIFRSRPGKLLLRLTVVLSLIALASTYLPRASVLGFVGLSPALMGAVIGVTLLYVIAAEWLKRALFASIDGKSAAHART